jgi:hypothetical protein
VKVELIPVQIALCPVMVGVGLPSNVNVLLAVAEQLLPLVTVTLKFTAVETIIAAVVSPVLHK